MESNISALANITWNGTDVILGQYTCPNISNITPPSLSMLSIFVLIIVIAKIAKEINGKYKFTDYNLDTDEIIFTCCIFLMMKYILPLEQLVVLAIGIFLYYRSHVKQIGIYINRHFLKKI